MLWSSAGLCPLPPSLKYLPFLLSPIFVCWVTPLIPLHNFLPLSSKLYRLFPPSFPSPPLPPWASELDCLPFGFPLFLPSSVPPLIAPLFLASQDCQLSGHSWKIHSRHGNCKQTAEETERDLQAFTAHRQKAGWSNSQLCLILGLLHHC